MFGLEWQTGIGGKIVREGDRINFGDLEVSIIEIPGHSSCSIAAYVPEIKSLFPSDGGGIPFKNIIITSGNSNYTKFQESLEKLRDLEVEYYCADHYGYLTGKEAGVFILRTIEAAKKQRVIMEEAYKSTGDINVAARELVSSFLDNHPDYILSPEILVGVYCQMTKHIVSAGR